MIAVRRLPPSSQHPASTRDLSLHVRKEVRRRQRADKRLFGRLCRDTRRSGGSALDSGQLARDVRRVLTLYHRAHVGGRGETVDLRYGSDWLVTVQVRLGVLGMSTGNTTGYPSRNGVRPNCSDENTQSAGDFAEPSTNP